MRSFRLFACIFLLAMSISACAAVPDQTPIGLDFNAHLAMNDASQTVITLEIVHPAGAGEIIDSFEGRMALYNFDGDLVAALAAPGTQAPGPGKRAFPASWRGELASGPYTLIWGAADYGYTSLAFTVSGQVGFADFLEVTSEDHSQGVDFSLQDDFGPVQSAVDAARTDLARRVNLPAEQVHFLSLQAAVFPDSSLGVPDPGILFETVLTPGAVIRLEAGMEEFLYHATVEGAGWRVVFVEAVPQADTPLIDIDSLRMVPQEYILFEGRSTLSSGSCLHTWLEEDGQAVAWWPETACIGVRENRWSISLPLGKRETPAAFNPQAEYVLQARWAFHEEVISHPFPFDFAGPGQ